MYTKARDSSVPIDTIERAIKRGSGELEGVRYESISYEGYAPDGVAVIVECLSDNRNRTGAEIRNLFSKNGGAMAEPGSVSWQFERKGVIAVPRAHDEERILEVAMEAGAEDLADEDERWLVTSDPADLMAVRNALEEAGLEPGAPELTMHPTSTVELTTEAEAKRVLRLVEALDDHDDAQNVYANFDIPDELMAAYDG
jgi:YebC/PmpR family DNA-binding regulatory protein